MKIKKRNLLVSILIRMGFVALGLFITGFPNPSKAQTTCRTHADCPCGQGCAEEGLCRNLAIPLCKVDEECSILERELFSGRCVDNLCELACRNPSELQGIIDQCSEGSLCKVPRGSFTITAPLQVRKSLQIVGAGRPGSRFGKTTEIRVADASRGMPAIAVEGDVRVDIKDLGLVGGGIKVGGGKDPCQGIDDPSDVFKPEVTVEDLLIDASALNAIHFSGGSLSVTDVETSNAEGTGLYVANASGSIVIQDVDEIGHEGWGIFICNLEGDGLIFINDVNLVGNDRGGLGVVGPGGPFPAQRPLCFQNATTSLNNRFGTMLIEMAPTSLLFNVASGLNPPDENNLFGDGITIVNSDDIALWNVITSFNGRAGYSIFEFVPGQTTHVHLFGDFTASDNPINMNAEGDAEFDAHPANSGLFSFCGGTFQPPAGDPHCLQGGEPDFPTSTLGGCQVQTSGLAPPQPLP